MPRTYELATDLLLIQGVPAVPVDGRWRPWAPLFYSKFFLADYDEIVMEEFELTKLRLKNYGKRVTQLRSNILNVAAGSAEARLAAENADPVVIQAAV